MKFTALLFAIVGLVFVFGCTNAQNAPKDLKSQLKAHPGKVVDVRTLSEWNGGHLSQAIHADWNNGDFEKLSKQWNKDEYIYLYCASGGRSGSATEYLKGLGFKHVTNLGGYSGIKHLDEKK